MAARPVVTAEDVARSVETACARRVTLAYRRGGRDGRRALLDELTRGGAFTSARGNRLANRARNELDREEAREG